MFNDFVASGARAEIEALDSKLRALQDKVDGILEALEDQGIDTDY